MTPEHNEFVLSTAYHSGWINLEQYHAAVAGLQAMPNVSAIDFLLEQLLINDEHGRGFASGAESGAVGGGVGAEAHDELAPTLPVPRIVAQPEAVAHEEQAPAVRVPRIVSQPQAVAHESASDAAPASGGRG